MQKDKIILSQFTLEEFSSVIIEKLKKELEPFMANHLISDVTSTQEIKFLKRKEAAARLRISLPTLDKYTASGQIPASRLPSGGIRYIESDIYAAMNKIKTRS